MKKEAKIVKLPNGKYQVQSEKGKNLGIYDSRKEAEDRLRDVEYFKHKDENDTKDTSIDLTEIDDFSFSATLRKMRMQCSDKQVKEFLGIYKKEFDKALQKELQKPEVVALQNALVIFSKVYDVKLSKSIFKGAMVSELGDPVLVGKYLSDIIKFTLTRISPERRRGAIESVRQKIYDMNENEISAKDLPPSSSMGQSLTFVKHVLFNHDARYIREVLNNIVRNLQ